MFFKVREEGLRAWLPLACTVSGVWWNKCVRLKLFQGVLVNYKTAGSNNYVNKFDTNPPVAALYFESWWAACLGLQGQKERMQSQ